MFTNWLTDSTSLTKPRSLVNSSTTRLPETINNFSAVSAKNSNASAGLPLLSGYNLNPNIISTPPDIVLEVGPAPTTVRFMAHGLILGMHSGYLRSAIRLDERGGASVSSSSTVGTSNVADIIVYLTNVTPDQFAPLLTYMYTGYLDLNVENIFGVLLATHVLHMPRALEICRSFLLRAQTEGYFGTNNAAFTTTNPHGSITPSNSGKIIRPIASKPQLTNFGFLPMSTQSLALNPLAVNTSITTATTAAEPKSNNSMSREDFNKNDEDDDIDVDAVDRQSLNNEKNQIPPANDADDEDIEVFIDSNSETEVVIETQMQKYSYRKLMETKKQCNGKDNKAKHHDKPHNKKTSHQSKAERRRKSSSGLQVAKAPIPASQLDCSEANKVIIDVASCDGPVRFKRILNTAYGHKPEAVGNSNNPADSVVMPERSLHSVSLSFHQQMAKTISQQQQLHQTEESENSETSNGSMAASTIRPSEKTPSGHRKIQSEVFVCVYCKHTFKSQYCYQKHAKRHLNPLTLQATCVPETKTLPPKEEPSLNSELQITKHQNINPTRKFLTHNSTHYLTSSTSASAGNSNTTTSSDYLKREVRPLDMNVQYYPCKTCGCKFPSYYFVHKHRKMCHADEEPQSNNSDNHLINSSQINTEAVATATTDASVNAKELLSSQNGD